MSALVHIEEDSLSIQTASEEGYLIFLMRCDLGKEAADVVLKAGIKGSDKSKADLINLMPEYLQRQVLPKLERLTSYDDLPWTHEWAGKMFEFC